MATIGSRAVYILMCEEVIYFIGDFQNSVTHFLNYAKEIRI